MADRRKLTDSDIIADEKLLAIVEAASHFLPTRGSRHFAATLLQCLQHDRPDCAAEISLSADRGQFLVH